MNERQTRTDFDLAIVGGGMVGAALACALADSPLRIALFDGAGFDGRQSPCQQAETCFDARVSAIAPASRQFLTELGAWQIVAQNRLSPYSSMEVWDADGTGAIRFSAADIHADCLGHIVENSVILLGLYERLQALNTVSQINPVLISGFERLADTAQEGGVRLIAEDGRTWTSTLLIGADGPQSRIRQLGGFATREWDYQHQALITTVRTSLPHRATALQRFMPSGPLAFLPLHTGDGRSADGQHYCSIVWSTLPAHAGQLQAMDGSQFASTLAAAIEHRLGDIDWVDHRHVIPLRQRHAIDYVQPGIALLGDAAHTIHPLAGQGVNLGFADAKALAHEIRAALKARRPLGEFAMLRRYQRARKGPNLAMMGAMEGFKFLFAQDALPIRWARNAGLRGIDRAGFIKNRLMRHAMGI